MKNYANRSRRATRNTKPTPIVCAGCSWDGRWGCFCHNRDERQAGEIIHRFLAGADRVDQRRQVIEDMREWALLDDIRRLEKAEERRLIAAARADKGQKTRGLTDGRLGGHLALVLMRRMLTSNGDGRPEPIEVIARRHRVPLAMVKKLRETFLRRTAFAATVIPASAPTARRLLQLGASLLAVAS